jgi:pimeloyl-ACP methyl ester carboxylesterase
MYLSTMDQKKVALPTGTIHYREAGSGPPVVFVHGFLVDGRLWDGVLERLAATHRVIAPDWPLGAHRTAMNPDADLTPPGIAATIGDFLDALDLEDVTLVGNDSGGAMSQIFAAGAPARLGRLALTNCDTHENFPPGIFKALPPLTKLPGGAAMTIAPFRIPALLRLAFRPFAKTRIPNELADSWGEPATGDRGVLRDVGKVAAGMDKRHTLAAAERLRGSELPLALLWAPGDRFFPIRYAERLASEVGGSAKLVRIPDAKTFVALDQPARLATELAEFAPSV